MHETGIVALLIIIANGLASYKGFKNHTFFEAYSFRVDRILVNREYYRLFTSGFLHVGWTHLILNMVVLFFFSDVLETYLGPLRYTLIYVVALVGGDLFSLFIHRNHGDYSAVGASGAVSGIVFAGIALFPGLEIGFLLMPFSIPAWAYGLLYVLISIYGIRSNRDNIGHDAHLGGGLAGLIIAIILFPDSLVNNYIPILLILVPSILFIYIILTKPEFLLVDNLFQKKRTYYNIEEKYNAEKRDKERELDRLLDKINEKGIEGLSKKEKERLEQISGGK